MRKRLAQIHDSSLDLRLAGGSAASSRRGVAPLGDRLVALHPAVADHDHARRVLGDVGLVGDQDDRDAALAVEPLQDLHDLDAGAAVEVAGGLVGEEQLGVVDQRAGDRDALLLAARELVRRVVRAVAEADRRRAGSSAFGAAAAARRPRPL